MKYIWEAEDIKPGVRYTQKGITEVHMIGYMASRIGHQRMVSISLEDGMVQDPKEAAEWAEMLTVHNYIPA